MNTRPIPSTKEHLPIIGMGTWQTFDVSSAEEIFKLHEVLQLFIEKGGSLVDSSPMYGRSELVLGKLLKQANLQSSIFLATKVWTHGKASGISQMEESFHKLQTDHINLMQVHNLVDWRTHLPVLNEWKSQGKIKYIGITHYHESSYSNVEQVLRNEKIDFLQINYSIRQRKADQRLLPLAQENGIAVLVNQPFESGSLFNLVKGKSLPDFVKEFNCLSWAEYFLKFILAHPAVTCVIPATSNPKHMAENLQAGIGSLPNEKLRRKMIEYILN